MNVQSQYFGANNISERLTYSSGRPIQTSVVGFAIFVSEKDSLEIFRSTDYSPMTIQRTPSQRFLMLGLASSI